MFIDSNIFISAYNEANARGANCRKFLERIKIKEQVACTSPMVLDEVVFVLEGLQGREFAIKRYRNILGMPNLETMQIKKSTCETAVEFMEKGLDPHDAFHASVMKENGVEVICSYDRHFDGIAGIKRQEPK